MAGPAAYQVASTVWRIPLAPFDFVNSYAFVEDDGRVTLVDTGTKGGPKRVSAGLETMGKSPRDVVRIVLTHAHPDHAGGAARLRELTGAPVSIHETDASWARDGKYPPRDPATLMGRLDNRSAQRKQKQAYPPVVVAEEFVDGQVLPVAGGLRVVHTPGHTLGHVALLHEPTGVLVTGDSIWNIRKLRWCIRSFCTDIKMNEQTAAVLGELDYDVAAFTHGAHVSDNARERVRGFLRDAKRFAGGR